MVLSCFEFILLSKSVRDNADKKLQRIQEIERMNPRMHDENKSLIPEFKRLLSKTCTFVNSWSDPIISPTTFHLYGKKYPSREASKKYVQQVKSQLRRNQSRESIDEDSKNPHHSHTVWRQANEGTVNSLDQKCKEPKPLLFFKGAVYQFTFNSDGNLSQAQLGILLDLPSQKALDNFDKIHIMMAPAGFTFKEYDKNKPSLSVSEKDGCLNLLVHLLKEHILFKII